MILFDILRGNPNVPEDEHKYQVIKKKKLDSSE